MGFSVSIISGGAGLLESAVLPHLEVGNHEHEVPPDTLDLEGLLLLLSDPGLFSLLGGLDLLLLLLDSLLLLSLALLLGKLSFDLVESLLVLLPALDLWDLVDTNCSGVWLEDLVLVVVQDLVSGLLGKSDSAVRVSLALLLELTKLAVIDATISVLASLPEGSQSNDNLVDLPDWVPRLWVIVRDRKADTLAPGVESSVGSLDNDLWSLGRILLWTDNFAHVEASLVLLVIEVEDDVVPDVDVLWIRQADEAIANLSSLLDLGLDVLLGHLALSLKSHLTSLVSSLHFLSIFKLNCY